MRVRELRMDWSDGERLEWSKDERGDIGEGVERSGNDLVMWGNDLDWSEGKRLGVV